MVMPIQGASATKRWRLVLVLAAVVCATLAVTATPTKVLRVVPKLTGANINSVLALSVLVNNPGIFQVIYQATTYAPAGIVVSESPAPGSSIANGATVQVI